MKKLLLFLFILIITNSAYSKIGQYLLTWGWNTYGQCGNDTNSQALCIPAQIGTDTSWSSISAGYYHTTAIKNNGTLWGWGNNEYGQLGYGTDIDTNRPTQIGTATDWFIVSAGGGFTTAIKNNGTLWAWGDNSDNQLGDGTTNNKNIPTQVGSDNNWSAVSAGGFHTLALKTDGTLWAWGYNNYGQLGDGTSTNEIRPFQIGTDNNWVAVSGGEFHSLALKSDGSLWAWGFNQYGQLGDGTNYNKLIPTHIGTATNWVTISAGGYHSLAVKNDGSLWTWGYNNYGQLGDGTYNDKNSPYKIIDNSNWSIVSAGSYHSLGIRKDGTLWAWGWNYFGQLGDSNNTDYIMKNYPGQIGINTNWTAISAGYYHSMGLQSSICAINTGSTSINFCSGNTIYVPFTIKGTFNSDNVFTAQLSSPNGNFAFPINVGSLNGTSSGTITCFIPFNTPSGTGYRIRIVSSDLSIAGSDNGLNITIKTGPATTISGPDSSCENDILTFNTSTGSDLKNQWTVNHGIIISPSNQSSVKIQCGSASASTTVTITQTNSNGCTNSATKIIPVNPLPSPIITGHLYACENSTISYYANDPGKIDQQWDAIGGIVQGTHIDDSVKVIWGTGNSGTITLTQTIYGTGCSSSTFLIITIHSLSNTIITGDDDVCLGNPVSYSVKNINGVTLKWVINNGSIIGSDSSNNVIIVSEKIGPATLTCTQTDHTTGCIVSIKKNINIEAIPIPTISGNLTTCENNLYPYKANSINNISYLWKIVSGYGNISGPTNTNICQVNWTSSGTANLRLVETNNVTGCMDSVTQTIIINPFPLVTVIGQNSVCPGDSVQYSVGNMSGVTSSWGVSNGTIYGNIADSTIWVVWSGSGPGEVVLTQTNSYGCKYSEIFHVTVNQKPNPIILGNETAQKGSSQIYTSNTPSGLLYHWSVTGGTLATPDSNSSVQINWGTSDLGKVYLLEINPVTGCKDSTEVDIQLIKSGIIINGMLNVCEGSLLTYSTPELAGNTYLWTVSGGTIQGDNSTQSINVLWGNAGTGILKLVETNTSINFEDSVLLNITINPTPTAKINSSGSTILCKGDSVMLNGTTNTGNCSFKWSTGETSQNIYANQGGWFIFTVISPNNCLNQDSIFIKYDTIQPQITGKLGLCSGASTTLSTNVGYLSYLWNTGDTSRDILVNQVGTYTIEVTDSNGCKGSASADVIGGTNPNLSIVGDSVFCSGSSIKLSASDDFAKYQWSTGEKTKDISIDSGGTYSLVVTDSNGCTASAIKIVNGLIVYLSINNLTDIGKSQIFVPKDTTLLITVTIPNYSIDTVSIASLNLTNNQQFKIINQINQINKSVDLTIEFTPDDYISFFDTLNIGIGEPCNSIYSVILTGTGTGKMLVWLPPEVDGTVNQKSFIPLNGKMLTQKDLTCDFNSDIQIDDLYILPDTLQAQTISYLSKVVNFNIKKSSQHFQTDSSYLSEIEGLVLLGPASQTPTIILTFTLSNPNIDVIMNNGILNDGGICGGDLRRIEFITPTTMSIKPNPSNGEDMEIYIESGISGNFNLNIYSIEGTKIFSVNWEQESPNGTALTHNYMINQNQIASGMYFVRLENGTELITKTLFMVK